MTLRWVFALSAVSATLAATPAFASAVDQSPRLAYDSMVRRLERIFETRTQNEIALQSLYTADAVLVEADGNTIVGRSLIVRDFRSILASGAVLRFKVRTTTFRTDGRLSYAGGIEEIDERDGVTVHHIRHRFLEVIERGRDGIWRLSYILEAAA